MKKPEPKKMFKVVRYGHIFLLLGHDKITHAMQDKAKIRESKQYFLEKYSKKIFKKISKIFKFQREAIDKFKEGRASKCCF